MALFKRGAGKELVQRLRWSLFVRAATRSSLSSKTGSAKTATARGAGSRCANSRRCNTSTEAEGKLTISLLANKGESATAEFTLFVLATLTALDGAGKTPNGKFCKAPS